MASDPDDKPSEATAGGEAAAGAAEPGAPVPEDAVDPELVSLRPRTQIGLITSLAVVVLCLTLAIRLWPDWRFVGEGKPVRHTAAEVAAGKVGPDSHIELTGVLDRNAAVRVRKTAGIPGLRVVPVAGTADRVWVVMDGDPWAPPREGAGYVGRLRPLDDLPFAAPLRAQIRREPPARYITGDELRRARTEGVTALTTVTGDPFEVAPGDTIEVVVEDPNAVNLVVSFNPRLPDAAAWATALVDAGLIAVGTAPDASSDRLARWEVRRPDAFASVTAALEKATLWGARLEPVSRRYRAVWSEAQLRDDGLVVADGTVLAWPAVDVVAVHAARRIPGGAWVVVTGELPERLWYVRWLYGLLVVFGCLFAWALARGIKREFLGPKLPTPA